MPNLGDGMHWLQTTFAEKLQMGSPLSARVAVCRFVNM
jgi:hypothetical protein